MRNLGIVALVSVLTFLPAGARAQSAPASQATKPAIGGTLSPEAREKLIHQARGGYYILQDRGFAGFQCQIAVDWDTMYSNLGKASPRQQQMLQDLKATRFHVVIGPSGASSVSHDSDTSPPDEDVANSMRKSIGGFEQIVTGFFQTWSGFVVTSLFPPPGSDYALDEADNKYRLSEKDASDSVLIVMNHDLLIELLQVETPKVNGTVTMSPHFKSSPDGLMLVGYSADIDSAGQKQHIDLKNDYQQVGGFQIPRTVTAAVGVEDTVVTVPITFTACQAKGK